MTTRTTQSVVHFSSPFLLPGLDAMLPAGDYLVDQEQEAIEGLSRLAWRRIGAFVYLPAIGNQTGARQMVPVNPADLDAAIAKEQNPS